jgi:hypothetical protein
MQQPGDARGQHAGLARAGAGQDQRRFGRQRDRGQLLGVQVLQQLLRRAAVGVHRGILEAGAA